VSGRISNYFQGVTGMATGLLLVFLLLYLLPLDSRPLTIPDETRYAEIPYEMLESGDWVTPRLNGLRYFEKPPLGYWLSAVSISLLGQNGFAVRLSTALAVGGTAFLVFFFTLRFFPHRQTAALAAFIYLTFISVFLVGTHATLDSLFTLFLTAGIMSYAAATLEAHPGRARLYWFCCGVALGLAFMVKGFIAFAVPVIVLVPWLLWQRQWAALLIKGWGVVVIAVLVVIPWALLIHQRESDFWHYFFWVEHIKRFSAENAQHKEPFYYYLMHLPWMMFPWISLLPAAIVGYLKSIDTANMATNRLLWLWILLPLLFFSSSSGKLGTYILPCFPPLAILLANGLYRYFQDSTRQRLFRWGMALNILAMAGLLCVLGYLQFTSDANAVYRDDELSRFYLLQVAIIMALLVGMFSLRQLDWRLRMLSLSALLIPVMALATISLPARVSDTKAPGQFILEVAPQIDNNSLVVSDASLFQAVNWYLGRRDVYLLYGGEVSYGLTYPDSSHRLLTPALMKEKIQQENRPSIAIFCHKNCPRGILELIPADASQQSFGNFNLILIR
jgi:4-amino-4-deoxy-L-arabinose transferase